MSTDAAQQTAPPPSAPPPPRTVDPDDSTYAEDLERDRRFERSLVIREAAVILLIALLILARQYFS